jgi:hypothetical protein
VGSLEVEDFDPTIQDFQETFPENHLYLRAVIREDLVSYTIFGFLGFGVLGSLQ